MIEKTHTLRILDKVELKRITTTCQFYQFFIIAQKKACYIECLVIQQFSTNMNLYHLSF